MIIRLHDIKTLDERLLRKVARVYTIGNRLKTEFRAASFYVTFRPYYVIYAEDENGYILGILIFYPILQHDGTVNNIFTSIENICVVEDKQRQGIGTSLIDALVNSPYGNYIIVSTRNPIILDMLEYNRNFDIMFGREEGDPETNMPLLIAEKMLGWEFNGRYTKRINTSIECDRIKDKTEWWENILGKLEPFEEWVVYGKRKSEV